MRMSASSELAGPPSPIYERGAAHERISVKRATAEEGKR